MAGWTRRLDLGLLLALSLALVAAAPFLARPGLPRQTDAELHVYRAAELGHVLRAGAFYPRWAPDLYFGYGYPIFNYYAPLTYYLANLFALPPGVGIVVGVKAVFVLGLLLASSGAYLLGRALFGPAAGVLVAACFVFSPYVVFIDPHARGDLAEHFAICLMPLAFFAFHRLMGEGGRGALLGSALTLGAVVFSHNLLGLVAGLLLLAYWAWMVAVGGGRGRAGWGALAFFLAAAMTAFFWLPFLMERDAIKLNVIGPGHFDFHEHFLSLAELLAPSRILDLGAVAPRYRFNLGVAQWALALPALLVVVREGRRRRELLYFLLAGLGLIFLMLPVSTPIWERIPGMAYLQFPWRLLGPTSLMLAICAGGSAALLTVPGSPSRGRWRNPALASGLAVILSLALPVLYPPAWPAEFGGTAPHDIVAWEQESLALGTTSTGDFLPVNAALVPMHPMPTLIESYARPGPVDRVNRFTLPEGAEVEIVDQGALHDRFAVSTPTEFVLRLYTFYFPGWRAYVDGEEVAIELAAPEGFITLWVPQGEHEVLVRFEDTPSRTAGWIISAAGLSLLLIALILMQPPGSQNSPLLPLGADDPSAAIWLGGVILFFVVLKMAVVDPQEHWLRYRSPPGEAWAAQIQFADGINFGGEIELLGYDLPRRRLRPGETVRVVLYWRALTPVGENYQSFVHLIRPPHLWSQEDHLNPGDLPTTRWPLDKYVWDEYEVPVPSGTPPGEYVLNVGLYSMIEDYRLQRYDGQGRVVGDSAIIGSVEVLYPRWQLLE